MYNNVPTTCFIIPRLTEHIINYHIPEVTMIYNSEQW